MAADHLARAWSTSSAETRASIPGVVGLESIDFRDAGHRESVDAGARSREDADDRRARGARERRAQPAGLR